MLNRFNYLNDNIIDFYLKLISHFQCDKVVTTISSYNFTKHFLNNVNNSADLPNERVRFISNIFLVNYVLIPICNNNHWTLIWINMDSRSIFYLNSLVSAENKDFINECFTGVKVLLTQIYHLFSKELSIKFDLNLWRYIKHNNLPQQTNGHDCGAFVCMYARCICYDFVINFKQSDIANCRLLIEQEITKFEIIESNIFNKTNSILNSA